MYSNNPLAEQFTKDDRKQVAQVNFQRKCHWKMRKHSQRRSDK